MSLVRLFPAWFHGFADFYAGIALIMVATYVNAPSKAVTVGIVVGVAILLLSLLTRYTVGLIRVLPFQVHSIGDYLAGIVLVGSPFVLGFTHSARSLTVTYVVFGGGLLLVSLLTNYRYHAKSAASHLDDRAAVNRWYRGASYYVSTAPVSGRGTLGGQGQESWRQVPASQEVRGQESWRETVPAHSSARPAGSVARVSAARPAAARSAPEAPAATSDWRPDPSALGGATVQVTKEQLLAELMAMQKR